jgi:hypothetical protein
VPRKTDTTITINRGPGFTPEQPRDIRAAAWRYVFECFAKKNTAGMTSTAGDDAKGSLKHEDRATEKYTG